MFLEAEHGCLGLLEEKTEKTQAASVSNYVATSLDEFWGAYGVCVEVAMRNRKKFDGSDVSEPSTVCRCIVACRAAAAERCDIGQENCERGLEVLKQGCQPHAVDTADFCSMLEIPGHWCA